MIIRVTVPTGPDGGPTCPPTWILLELQGKLTPTAAPSFDGVTLGTITTRSDGKLLLYVGNHRVAGELVALPKPLAVIARERVVGGLGGRGDTGDGTGGSGDEDEWAVKQYSVVAVVRQKFVFRDRPQPVVGGVSR